MLASHFNPYLTSSIYVQMRVVVFIEDDFQQVLWGLFGLLVQTINLPQDNLEWIKAIFFGHTMPIPELKVSFNHSKL